MLLSKAGASAVRCRNLEASSTAQYYCVTLAEILLVECKNAFVLCSLRTRFPCRGCGMFCRVVVMAVCICSAVQVSSETAAPVTADIFLVLKNGAGVRGEFLSLIDGQYTLRLPDGRVMGYSVDDVDRIERVQATPEESTTAPLTPAAPPSAPFSCETFISEKDVDKSLYTTIKDIKVSKKWYGSSAEMYDDLAAKARKTGADAVINAHTWHAPSGFAWAAPHAGGMAVKWTDAGRRAIPNLEGRCY